MQALLHWLCVIIGSLAAGLAIGLPLFVAREYMLRDTARSNGWRKYRFFGARYNSRGELLTDE